MTRQSLTPEPLLLHRVDASYMQDGRTVEVICNVEEHPADAHQGRGLDHTYRTVSDDLLDFAHKAVGWVVAILVTVAVAAVWAAMGGPHDQ